MAWTYANTIEVTEKKITGLVSNVWHSRFATKTRGYRSFISSQIGH